jgi:hypothetical protein
VFYPGSDKLLNARTLRCLLDGLININRVYLEESKRLDYAVPLLYQSGVVYDRTTWWESIPALHARTYGDCKSLTAAWIAEQRMRGIQCRPTFRFLDDENDGTTAYHILVDLGSGNFEDPSKVLGMGAQEVAKYYGPRAY